ATVGAGDVLDEPAVLRVRHVDGEGRGGGQHRRHGGRAGPRAHRHRLVPRAGPRPRRRGAVPARPPPLRGRRLDGAVPVDGRGLPAGPVDRREVPPPVLDGRNDPREAVSAALQVVESAWAEGYARERRLTVSEWADAHRELTQTSSREPGRWRTSRTPYLREIMDELSPQSRAERVVFMKGAQIGGTEAGNNWIGFTIHHNPGPMLMVLPTIDVARRVSKQRIAPMIRASRVLRERVRESRARDSGNTLLTKEYDGGVLLMAGANSSAGLRSMPVRDLFPDELDDYPPDVDGQGDPLDLAEERTNTYEGVRKIYCVSTPT